LAFTIEVDFGNAPSKREIIRNDLEGKIQIEEKRESLKNALHRYLNGALEVEELSDWAAFIFMSSFYIPKGESEEERWREGEGAVWDILQRLITPSIFGGTDFEIVRNYLEMLDVE
jgi:hypothetical protein